jgi:hypothetical protein
MVHLLLKPLLLVHAVRCVGLARQFIVIWFDHTQPSPSLPMASTGHPSGPKSSRLRKHTLTTS